MGRFRCACCLLPASSLAGKSANFAYRVLEANIPNKCAALAAEAIWAARKILERPHTVRGGPWVTIEMTKDRLKEIEQVARRASVISLEAFAASQPGGLLRKHLKDLAFRPDPISGYRGAAVMRRSRSGPSGPPGNANRKSQIARGMLKKSSRRYTRLHRGRDAKACRGRETANRKLRNAS